jgi:uncharacterized protein YbjT (DUF2867 family)
MNYIITGSLGHISKPIVKKLISAGHSVTVITSNSSRSGDIQTLGAKAAVGSLEDKSFLQNTFANADAVYLMIPPNFAPQGGFKEYQKKVTHNFVDALTSAKVKHAVLLSSVGAHIGKGTGPVDGLAYAEWHLSQVKDLNLKILRPSYFFYNLMGQISMVKNMNIFGANYGSTKEKLVLVHTDDIADAAAQELLTLKFKGKSIQYVASDECHPNEIAEVLGKAINKPGTPWVEFKDEDALQGMLHAGLNAEIAKGYVELGVGLRNGTAQADYWKNKPKLGKVKLKDFAKEFAAAFNA